MSRLPRGSKHRRCACGFERSADETLWADAGSRRGVGDGTRYRPPHLCEICRQASHTRIRVARGKCDEIEQACPGAPIIRLPPDLRLFTAWERWAAEVAESHTTYLTFARLRSPRPLSHWLVALIAVMDAAALH